MHSAHFWDRAAASPEPELGLPNTVVSVLPGWGCHSGMVWQWGDAHSGGRQTRGQQKAVLVSD